MLRSLHLIAIAGSVVASMPCAPVSAAQQRRADALINTLQQCRAKRVDAERLACFEQSSAAIDNARASGEVVVVDREGLVAERRQRFGLANAMARGLSDIKGAEVSELNSTILAVSPSRIPNRFDIELASGSTWQSIDSVRSPRVGAPIKITSARLGGFRATIGEGRSFLVKRVR